MTNSRVKIWLRRILILLAFVFAFILVLLYLAPGIALLGANHWYQKQGEGYSLTAKDWTFAPFRTELEFTGLVLEHPGSGSCAIVLFHSFLLYYESKAELEQSKASSSPVGEANLGPCRCQANPHPLVSPAFQNPMCED